LELTRLRPGEASTKPDLATSIGEVNGVNPEHLIALVAAAILATNLIMLAGVWKRALEWKHASRNCPSCGRHRRDCQCRYRE
jgi:hypothetical protein